MPHKDRKTRLDYMTKYREAHRPAPQEEAQDGDRPPLGRMRFSEDGERVQCHACGRWLRALNTHLGTHDLDADSYRERYGLARTLSLWPPALKAKQRDIAYARELGAIGKAQRPPPAGRPVGQEARLSARIDASEQRKGRNLRKSAPSRYGRKDSP